MKKNIVMTLSAVLLATSLVACAKENAASSVTAPVTGAAPSEQTMESVSTIENYVGTSGWSIYYDTKAFTLKEVSNSTRIRLEYNNDATGLTYVAYDEASGTNLDDIIFAMSMNYDNPSKICDAIYGNSTAKIFTAVDSKNADRRITVAVIDCNNTFVAAEISQLLTGDEKADATAAGYLAEVVHTLNVPVE